MTVSARQFKDLWSAYARVYDRLVTDFPLYRQLVSQLAALLRERVQPGAPVLDAGCGTGALARELAGHARVTAADSCAAMLAQVARRADPVQRLQPVRLDLSGPLPFRDNSFAAIACIHVLYALPTPEETLREFRRVLRPGGVLISANMTARIAVWRALRELFRLYGPVKALRLSLGNLRILFCNLRLARLQQKGIMRYWAADEYAALLDGAGFRTVHQETGYICDADLITVATC